MSSLYQISKSLKNEIYFVIPAWNEGKAIGNVIKNLQSEGYNNLVIIDDGSTDDTSKVVQKYTNENFEKRRFSSASRKITSQKYNIRDFHRISFVKDYLILTHSKFSNDKIILLNHVVNRGQGAGLKTGINYCLKKEDCKYIVTFDSDGQHRISDLSKFIKKLETKKYDIVLGSRFLNEESRKLVPLKKKILLKGALFITMFLSSIKLSDTHNGYRVMNKKAGKNINISFDGFEHASEILDEIAKKKIKYCEVPVFIDYTDYSKAKGQKISNSIKILIKMLLRG